MSHPAWKKRERAAARALGAERNIGSGSMGRADKSRSDSTHETIFLECKHRQKHSVVTLWDDTKAKAKKEGKTPVIALTQANRPGLWYVVKDTDLLILADVVRAQIQADVDSGQISPILNGAGK